jgi:hypothetical protein
MTISTLDERIAKHSAREESAKKQHQQIEAARKLLQPGEVKLHKIPGWLKLRVRAYRRRKGWNLSRHIHCDFEDTIPEIAREIGIEDSSHWLDHWGTSTETRYACCNVAGTCFVSEPYGFHTETAKLLDALAAAFDLTWHVLPNSWWYPGHTQRIVLHRRQKAPLHASIQTEISNMLRTLLGHLTDLAANAEYHLRRGDYLRKELNLAQRRLLEAFLALQVQFPVGGFDVLLHSTHSTRIDDTWHLPAVAERLKQAQGQLAEIMEALLETLHQDTKSWKKLVGVEQALDEVSQTIRFINP